MTVSGERLTTRLRVQLFKSLLHKDVGWYDEEEHTTGALTALLSVDANNVKKVMTFCCIYLYVTNEYVIHYDHNFCSGKCFAPLLFGKEILDGFYKFS